LDTTHVRLSICLWAGYSQWAGSVWDTTHVRLSTCLWAGYSQWAGSVLDTTHVRLSTCLWAGYSQWAGSALDMAPDTRASVYGSIFDSVGLSVGPWVHSLESSALLLPNVALNVTRQ